MVAEECGEFQLSDSELFGGSGGGPSWKVAGRLEMEMVVCGYGGREYRSLERSGRSV